jgi:hypothetical protein
VSTIPAAVHINEVLITDSKIDKQKVLLRKLELKSDIYSTISMKEFKTAAEYFILTFLMKYLKEVLFALFVFNNEKNLSIS